MFEKLPSLRGFQPKFYSGGPARVHLPLFYDLATQMPAKRVVVLGFGGGEAFFTFCQASVEQQLDCKCIAVRRDRAGESETDDIAWREGKDYGEEFYGAECQFFENRVAALTEIDNGSVDVLLIDDSDSGEQIAQDLESWTPKLTRDAVVLLHGLRLERDDSPAMAWNGWIGERAQASFGGGVGLGVAFMRENAAASFFLQHRDDLTVLYSLAAREIDATTRAKTAEKKSAAFATRQIWLDSLLTDRRKVQEIMDHQARVIASLEGQIGSLKGRIELLLAAEAEQRGHFENLRRDRAKAQLIMDTQHEQLKRLVTQTDGQREKLETLKAQLKEHKAILSAAKKACRKGGRCFQIQRGVKVRRPLLERIARELRRLPRNLGIAGKTENEVVPQKVEPPVTVDAPPDRYEAWIAAHEPDTAALGEQRRTSQKLSARPRISLLTPVHNTPADFLEEMVASVAAQTYENWELCVVDAASGRPETLEILRRWEARDERVRVQRLSANFSIAENTNHALKMATGDFVACLDHDDVLAPFALYELARAIEEIPGADIFYSDEDRLSEKGKRHAPFFKPEWDPELLCASMYIGHLSAYRRSLALELGGFRKEFDLSQDYDFALRASERAKAIHHIPHILYHWREHPESGSTGGKPDARKTNLAALADAMRRRNLPAEIIEYPTANRARLKIERWPRVSIMVPTDSATRAQACLQDLPRATKYPDLEIVLVTNSQLAESLKFLEPQNASVRLLPYNKTFNFSDKCNAGATVATGERLIFFNDDVETEQADWIQNLIEPLENPEIGAVAPKLLYESGKIQHAGLVMGVRGLAGTAFHQRPAESTEHFNLAQTERDVAALSAACLAMRREDFFRVGGFDAVNTPIAHSDMDLCFKVREAGLRCVYTPYATLRHAGHASIGVEESQGIQTHKRPRDKANIFLLKRWAGYTTHDPFFTDNMRDWLHVDSPTPIRMFGRNDSGARIDTEADLLFVSHDLSLSGAPMMLFHAATWCRRHGMFVTVMAPEDGALRAKYEAENIPVIVDPLVETEHESFAAFARDFDCIVANTIRTSAVVRALKGETVPVVWWLHEPGSVGEHYLREEARLRAAMPLADLLLAPSESTASVYLPYTESPVKSLPNAIPDLRMPPKTNSDFLRFLLLASIEPRKGQDIFVKALTKLPVAIRQKARFEIAGRTLDPNFWPPLEPVAKTIENLFVTGAANHAEAIAKLSEADVLVAPSRDEAMPTVTILEAMSLGKAIITTNVGGATESFTDRENALLVRPESPDELAAAIRRLIEDRALVTELGQKARETYERNFTIERFGVEFLAVVRDAMAAGV